MPSRIVPLAVTGMAGLLLLSWAYPQLSQSDDKYANCRQGVAGGDIGGAFTLVNGAGQTVTDKEVLAGPSLVYFGYTFCPDVCPLDMSRNAEAVDILENSGQLVTPVFISVDTKRDTPEVVADFADRLHPRMIGLTGTDEQIAAASRAYKTYFKANDDGSEYFLIDHSTFTYLILPDIGFADFFRRDVSSEEMAKRVSCFLDA